MKCHTEHGEETVLGALPRTHPSDGHEVFVAYDGRLALARASSFDSEFVLLDLDLRSDLGGHEVCRELHASSKRRPCIIAMTPALAIDRIRLREIGFDTHVSKLLQPTRALQCSPADGVSLVARA